MRELVARNFTSRNLDYRASCAPRQVDVDSYGIRGEFLKPLQP